MFRPIPHIIYKMMALILSLLVSMGVAASPATDDPLTVDDNASLTFVALGDCQLSTVSYKRQIYFSNACQDIDNANGQLDALMIVGDIAENGLVCEYDTVRDMINANNSTFDHFLVTQGNHDIRMRFYTLQNKTFSDFVSEVEKSVPLNEGRYNYSYEIKGYKFIVLGSDTTDFEESRISDEQLKWLDSEIASTSSTGKPCFVLAHQPLQFTHGLPDTWGNTNPLNEGSIGKQSDEIKVIFEKHNNVVFINGHLHTAVCKESYNDFGSFKSLNVPSVTVNKGEGYVVSVYGDRIEIRARNFASGKYLSETNDGAFITIPLVNGGF